MASPMGIEGTWFDGLRRKWQNVPIDASRDNAIATSEFLEAAESVTPLCGLPDLSLNWTMSSICVRLIASRSYGLGSIRTCEARYARQYKG